MQPFKTIIMKIIQQITIYKRILSWKNYENKIQTI